MIRMKARWKNVHRRTPGSRNKLEAAYEQHLETLKRAGEIIDYRFEAFKLRLADLTTITPDFAVLMNDGLIEMHDTKGSFFAEHNRAKWKVAIEMFPWFTFVIVRKATKKNGGSWLFERFE